jgi:[acyl-carrier-protein] S-malonyltransferase
MGRSLYRECAEARKILETAEARAELPATISSLQGPREELMQPAVLEPAIVALEIAYVEELRRRDIRPDVVAGYSLGEIAAFYCAEVITVEEALQIAVLRGRILQKMTRGAWRMAVVSGLPVTDLEAIASKKASGSTLAITAHNAPGHFAIAGEMDAVLRAEVEISSRGGVTIPIEVAGPWHCPVATPAAIEIHKALESFNFRPPKIPLYLSSTGTLVTKTGELCSCLANQICLPILWNEVLDDLWRRGARQSLEVGPGHVLTAFVRRTWPTGQYQARFLERENSGSLARELLPASASSARHTIRPPLTIA